MTKKRKEKKTTITVKSCLYKMISILIYGTDIFSSKYIVIKQTFLSIYLSIHYMYFCVYACVYVCICVYCPSGRIPSIVALSLCKPTYPPLTA